MWCGAATQPELARANRLAHEASFITGPRQAAQGE
jgi:hypothetical protein